MSSNEVPERVVLFADIGESTQLYEELGDEAARELTRACLDRMIECVAKHGGAVIKTIGDEVMASFPSAEAGYDGALALVAAARERPNGADRSLGAHVGFHLGPVLEEGGDVFGDTVNVAARMVGLAKNDEMLTTRAVVERLDPERRAATRQIDRLRVKGKDEGIDVFEVMAQGGGETSMVRVAWSEDLAGGCLILRLGPERLVVDASHPAITIGRADENDLVVLDPWVSRRHARIRLRHGKFVLHDESANGTLVVTDEGRRIPLHREDLTLHGAGRLGVNRPDAEPTSLPIRFRVESA